MPNAPGVTILKTRGTLIGLQTLSCDSINNNYMNNKYTNNLNPTMIRKSKTFVVVFETTY